MSDKVTVVCQYWESWRCSCGQRCNHAQIAKVRCQRCTAMVGIDRQSLGDGAPIICPGCALTEPGIVSVEEPRRSIVFGLLNAAVSRRKRTLMIASN